MRNKKKTQNNLNQVIKVIALSMNRTSNGEGREGNDLLVQ